MLDLDQTAAADPSSAPFTPLSDDEIRRRLKAAGLPYHHPMRDDESTDSTATTAPPVPGTGASVFPSAPKPPSYAAPDLSGGGPANFGASAPAPKPLGPAQPIGYGAPSSGTDYGVPVQFKAPRQDADEPIPGFTDATRPRAPRNRPPDSIVGFEQYDGGTALNNVLNKRHGDDGQDQHLARQAQAYSPGFNALPGYGDPSTAGQRAAQRLAAPAAGASPTVGGVATASGDTGPGTPTIPGTSGQPGQPKSPGAKPYTVGDDGALQLDTTQPTSSLLGAYKDGLIDEGKLRELLPKAQEAETALAEQKRIAAENPAAWKAFLSGGAKGVGFLAAAPAGAAIGAEIGALGGPLAPATVPIGGVVGGLVGGTVGSLAVSKSLEALGRHSQTIQSFNDASKIHPYADAAGNLVSFAGGLPKVLTTGMSKGVGAVAARFGGQEAGALSDFTGRVLTKTAQGYAEGSGSLIDTARNFARQAEVQAAGGASAIQIAKQITGQVAKSAGQMIAVDSLIKEVMYDTGLSEERQTLSGVAQAGLIGAFLSGHRIEIPNHPPEVVGSIVAQGRAAEAAGADVEHVLGKKAAEIYRTADAKIREQLEQGNQNPKISVDQVLQHDQPVGVAVAKVAPPADSLNPSASRGELPPTTSPVGQSAPVSPSPVPPGSSAPDASALPAPGSTDPISPRASSEGRPSPTPTNPTAAGQAEPVVTRANGVSTITRDGTTISVPIAQEASALEIMRRSSTDKPSSATSPRLDPTAPDSLGTPGARPPETLSPADRTGVLPDQSRSEGLPSNPPVAPEARRPSSDRVGALAVPDEAPSSTPQRAESSAFASPADDAARNREVPSAEPTTEPGLVTSPPAPRDPNRLTPGEQVNVTRNGTLHTVTEDNGGPTIRVKSPGGSTVAIPRAVALKNRVASPEPAATVTASRASTLPNISTAPAADAPPPRVVAPSRPEDTPAIIAEFKRAKTLMRRAGIPRPDKVIDSFIEADKRQARRS